ncbi:MAG TPA: hypothetical protein VFB96_08980 [Pirellulaceae bacterium]|nr:hypothetical protein [Pirellulaceae bacterium]
MSLSTVTLGSESAALPFGQVVEQAREGGIQVKDASGNVVAFVLPPNNLGAWTEAELVREIAEHRDEIRAAMQRGGGATTAQMLEKARQAASQPASS